MVIIGIGVIPNTELAESAGLKVDNGICVDAFGQTNDPNIFAIGDCSSFVHPVYDRSMRLESVQNATEQAVTVAKAITMQPEPYNSIPWFWSDQYDVKLQIAGLADGYDELVVRGDFTSGRSMSVAYLKNKKLLAVDAINNPRDFVQGKKLITGEAMLDAQILADQNVDMIEAATPKSAV